MADYIEELGLDNDYMEDTLDHEDYGTINTSPDRGGQFHLQSAILPMKSMLPERSTSRYQTKMIQAICDLTGHSTPSYDQIMLFSAYMTYCSRSTHTPFSLVTARMAKDILERECEVFEMLLGEPDMKRDVMLTAHVSMTESRYQYHINKIQKAVYIYNVLLSKRLGDEDLKEALISKITEGKGRINEDKTVVTYCYDDLGWTIYITREVIGWLRADALTVTHASILLNISDKLQERFNIQMITEIGSRISPTVYPSWRQVEMIIEWGDNIIRDLGNEGYRLLSNFESLMISQLIKKEDNGFDNGKFQENILNDIYNDGIYTRPYVEQLLNMIDTLSHFHIAQLHGLYRIWGHPEVDSAAGMRKVGDLLKQTKHPDSSLEHQGRMTFREVFMVNYFNKHGYYPPVEWNDSTTEKENMNKSSYIRSRIASNLAIDTRSIYYNKDGWTHMSFQKCFPVPTGLNIASFLKDKAVSPDRRDLIDMIQSTGRVTDPYKRRGVLKWLSTQPIDVTKLMESINASPTGLPKNDCTIGLYPKEREMKLEARMFALMSYRMRIYFVMTEEMLSHHILPYFPQIAMNDNFLAIQKKFVDFTTPMAQSAENEITYIVNIDFKKWNQQMRRDITLGIFTDLGMMFGLKELYNRTYDIFMNSFVYLCNGTFTPRVVRGALSPQYPLSWEGDQGGKEGLRQKGWTIVSAMDLYNICKEHNFTFKIIGGGDNQVLVITMPSQDGDVTRTHRRMDRFLIDLDEKMKKRGLPLKIGETWVSSSLFAYNKYMIYKGVQLPSTLKLAGRCFHLSNTDLMTIENMAGTLAVTYQSIISKDFSCLVGWIFSRINMAHHASAIWEHHPFLGKSIPEILTSHVVLSGVRMPQTFKNQLTKQTLFYMMVLFPRVLGGSGTLNLLSYMSRGFPDGLSEWCTYLYLMSGGSNVCLNKVIDKILSPTKRSMPVFSKLLEDPVCLSLDSAEIGSGALRNIALKFIEGSDRITNRGFLQFLTLSSKQDVEKMADTLCSGKKIVPRELHDIIGSTIYGYMSSILAKIDKSTTINKLGEGIDVLEQIRSTECNWINYCAYRMTVRHYMDRDKCPTRTAEMWRNESWGKPIIGVTTPHPAAFLRPSQGKFHPDCDGNFILHVNLYRKHVDTPYLRSGPCTPYLGSYTKEKSLGTELASAFGNESLVRRPIHLQKLIGWRYPKDGCMSKIIRKCLQSVTDITGEYFESDPRCVTGDAEHRYKDKATKHEGVINNLYYWSTWSRTLTDTFIKHSRGGKNETLQFQVCMLYINSLTAMINDGSNGSLRYFIRLKDKHIGEVHYHEWCNTCIVPLQDPPEVEIAPRHFPPIPTCPNNPYLYITKEMMSFSYSEVRDMEEHDATMLSGSILEQYDGRVALSLLTGCVLGRALAGSRHEEEKLTDSAWRMIMGKIDVPVMLNGMVNYLIAWKFYCVMMRGGTIDLHESILLHDIIQNSDKVVKFFDKLMSHIPQKKELQVWCGANDTGLILGDIESKSVTYEIVKRIQINSYRTAITMHKTRGESLDKEEKIIRALMRLKYVAVDCTECQTYVRQYMKNNIVKRCLCPHDELQAAIKSPVLVWPEGLESLSKRINLYINKRLIRSPRVGLDFIEYSLGSFSSVAKVSLRCTSTGEKNLKLTHSISNLPMLYQVCRNAIVSRFPGDDPITIIDTYDGILESMLKRNIAYTDRAIFKRVFRHSRPEYYMQGAYMSGDDIYYRLEDTSVKGEEKEEHIMEVENIEEFMYLSKERSSYNNTYVIQVHTFDVLDTIRTLSSMSTGGIIKMARATESICWIIIAKFVRNKGNPCLDVTYIDAVRAEIIEGSKHIQSRVYDSWAISSGTCEKNSMVELSNILFFNLDVPSVEAIIGSWRKIMHMVLHMKEKRDLSKVHALLVRYVDILRSLSFSPKFPRCTEGCHMEMFYPNMIKFVENAREDVYDVRFAVQTETSQEGPLALDEVFEVEERKIAFRGSVEGLPVDTKRKKIRRDPTNKRKKPMLQEDR